MLLTARPMPIDIRNGRYFSRVDPVRVQLALAHHVEVGHRRRGREEQRHVDEQHLVPAHVVADDHRRRHQHRQHAHQRVVEVGRQVEERLGLDARAAGSTRRIARQQLAAGLDGALGPAVLLRLEGVHLDRQLGRRHQVRAGTRTSSRATARGSRGRGPRSACRAASRRRR